MHCTYTALPLTKEEIRRQYIYVSVVVSRFDPRQDPESLAQTFSCGTRRGIQAPVVSTSRLPRYVLRAVVTP